ncbi:MAG: hypothetical protein JWO53_327 [Chlamydiia bacterium]|nr:hypothetical protein [Chlamydiia bacterium]
MITSPQSPIPFAFDHRTDIQQQNRDFNPQKLQLFTDKIKELRNEAAWKMRMFHMNKARIIRYCSECIDNAQIEADANPEFAKKLNITQYRKDLKQAEQELLKEAKTKNGEALEETINKKLRPLWAHSIEAILSSNPPKCMIQ